MPSWWLSISAAPAASAQGKPEVIAVASARTQRHYASSRSQGSPTVGDGSAFCGSGRIA